MERLAARYLRLFPAGRERPVPGFSFRAMQAMREYDWPGNTRELVRRLKRAVVLCQGDLIDTADLGLSPPEGTQTQPLTLEQAKSAAEKQVIVTTLRATDHNVSRTARRLAISRMTLYRLLDKHQLRSDSHSEH
jgi:DNA-binding NtrC family response regulator